MSCLQVDTIRPNHNCAVKICCVESERGTSADYQGTSATFNTATIANVNVVTGTIGTIQSTRGNFGTLDAPHGTVGTLIATTGTISILSVTLGTIGTLFTTNGTIGSLNVTGSIGTIPALNVTDGTIDTIYVTNGTIDALNVTVGTIPSLTVSNGTFGTLNVEDGTIGTLNVSDATINILYVTNGTIGTLNTGEGTIGMFRGNDATFGEFGFISGDDAILGSVYMPISLGTGLSHTFKIETNRNGATLTNNCYWDHLYSTVERYDDTEGATSILIGRGDLEIYGCNASHADLDHYATFTPHGLTLYNTSALSNTLSINADSSMSIRNRGIVLEYGSLRGGDASVLDHYEEYNHVSNVTGPWAGVVNPYMQLTRVGRVVSMTWRDILSNWTTNAVCQLQVALPARFRPAYTLMAQGFSITVIDIDNDFMNGVLAVSELGAVVWYSGEIMGEFTHGSGTVGVIGGSVSWTV